MTLLPRAAAIVAAVALVFAVPAPTSPASAAPPPFDLLTALRTAYQERGETVSFAGLTTQLESPSISRLVTTTLQRLGYRSSTFANTTPTEQAFTLSPDRFEERHVTSFSVSQPLGASIRLGRDQGVQFLSIAARYPVASNLRWTEPSPHHYENVTLLTTTIPETGVPVPAGATYRYEDWIERVLTESTVTATSRLTGDLILRNRGRTFAVPVGQALTWLRAAGDTRVPASIVVDGASITTPITIEFSGITGLNRVSQTTNITPTEAPEWRSSGAVETPRVLDTTRTPIGATVTPPPHTIPFPVDGTPATPAASWQRIPLTASDRVLTEKPMVGNIRVQRALHLTTFTANAAALSNDQRLIVHDGDRLIAEAFRGELVGMTRVSQSSNGDVVFSLERSLDMSKIYLAPGSFKDPSTNVSKATLMGASRLITVTVEPESVVIAFDEGTSGAVTMGVNGRKVGPPPSKHTPRTQRVAVSTVRGDLVTVYFTAPGTDGRAELRFWASVM